MSFTCKIVCILAVHNIVNFFYFQNIFCFKKWPNIRNGFGSDVSIFRINGKIFFIIFYIWFYKWSEKSPPRLSAPKTVDQPFSVILLNPIPLGGLAKLSDNKENLNYINCFKVTKIKNG